MVISILASLGSVHVDDNEQIVLGGPVLDGGVEVGQSPGGVHLPAVVVPSSALVESNNPVTDRNTKHIHSGRRDVGKVLLLVEIVTVGLELGIS